MWENSTDYGFFCDIECPEYETRYMYKTIPFSFSTKKPKKHTILLPPLPAISQPLKNAHDIYDSDYDYDDDEDGTTILNILFLLSAVGLAAYCLFYQETDQM